MSKLEELWEMLLNELSVSEECLRLITNLNGYNLETLEDVYFYVTGEYYEE